MRSKVVGLVAAAALSASVGIANAKGPVKLTDGQLDKVTAGATQTSANLAGNVTATHLQGNVSGNQLFSGRTLGRSAGGGSDDFFKDRLGYFGDRFGLVFRLIVMLRQGYLDQTGDNGC